MYVSTPGQMRTLMGMAVPTSVAVDTSGNVYSPDIEWIQIWKWTATNNAAGPLDISGLSKPWGVAVDNVANVYMVDYAGWAGVWLPVNNTGGTLCIGLTRPEGIAVDDAGNVYIADTGASRIAKWSPLTRDLTTVVSSGLGYPGGVVVDKMGNLYIADSGGIEKWTAASSSLTNLVSAGLNSPSGVAVDGSGNVYIADTYDNAIKEWTPGNNTVTALVSSGLYTPYDVAVDQTGVLYIADTGDGVVKAFGYGFVDPTAKLESSASGYDVLPIVLTVKANLLDLFPPTSDAPWLTITGITNGVVGFSVATNSGPPRIGLIKLLGLSVPIVQVSTGPPIELIAVPTPGAFKVALGDTQNSSFTVLSSTNPFLPMTN